MQVLAKFYGGFQQKLKGARQGNQWLPLTTSCNVAELFCDMW
jgi:hypothetical protein